MTRNCRNAKSPAADTQNILTFCESLLKNSGAENSESFWFTPLGIEHAQVLYRISAVEL